MPQRTVTELLTAAAEIKLRSDGLVKQMRELATEIEARRAKADRSKRNKPD